MPIIPPLVPSPNLAVSDTTLLQARIAALEAKIDALEAVIKQGADGLTITSTGNISIKASKDLFIRAERDTSVEIHGAAIFAIDKSWIAGAREMVVTTDDHFRLDCGTAAIDAKKAGSLDLTGNRINVKGSGDVVIKGSKVTQN